MRFVRSAVGLLNRHTERGRLNKATKKQKNKQHPVKTRRANAGLMLGQRRRRWANINPALVQCPVFAGEAQHSHS